MKPLALIDVLLRLLLSGLLLSACAPAPNHHWTCAEVLGAHPTPGELAVLPPKWRMEIDLTADGAGMTVYDEYGQKACSIDPPRAPKRHALAGPVTHLTGGAQAIPTGELSVLRLLTLPGTDVFPTAKGARA